jgi:hypothetical protein
MCLLPARMSLHPLRSASGVAADFLYHVISYAEMPISDSLCIPHFTLPQALSTSRGVFLSWPLNSTGSLLY